MNGKKIACVILMMILASIAYGTQIMQKRAKGMLEEADNAETDAKTAETQRKVADTEVTNLKFKTQDLRQFLKDWEPNIKRMQTTQEAEQALQSIVRNSRILIVSQKFEVRENRESKITPKLLQGTLIVQDEYAKTMNWLGELERRMPLTRITSCRVKQGDTGRQVNVEIHFEIPIVNLDAQMDDQKK
jgi:hypothetical protein